ncbi:MAG: Lnb N-terminal periplasmic domain-containing protein [Gammaproteobacteria bacterium]
MGIRALIALGGLLTALNTGEAGERDLDYLLEAGDYDQVVERALGEDHPYLQQLIRRADQLQLHMDPAWHALMHYRKNFWGGYTSEVDGANFFTSGRGHSDPRQELFSTLASFFSERPVPPSIHTPQCRFLARYHWLKRKLSFDTALMPAQPCNGFDVFYKTIEPTGLTVVFPSTHPNSPSSMFGHTLIRIDGKGQDKASRMLDFTINYAAEADNSNAMGYAVKGLTGGFVGRFRVIPYHMKLREYAQMENRDIWEYKLRVSQQTVDSVLMHAWELVGTHFDYYFFTENCSYHVLTLLEADLYPHEMTAEFGAWVLPTDTLRVLDENGLVERVDYFPSSYRKIVARRARLGPKEDQLSNAIYADGVEAHRQALEQLPVDRQAAILDMAFDYLRYRKIAARNVLEPELSKRERQLLISRSRLKVVSEELAVAAPGSRPDKGHATARVSVGAGGDDNGGFLDFGWRGVYHDWLDPADGYSSNFALEFGRLGLRYYTGELSARRVKLEHLYLVNLDNYESRDDFFRPVSWHLSVGGEAVSNARDERDVSLMLRGGPGLSYRLGGSGLLAYAGADVEAGYSEAFRSNAYVGAGPAVALMRNITGDWRMKLAGRYLFGLTREDHDRATFSFQQSWRLGRDLTFNAGAAARRRLDGWLAEGSVWLNVYY